MLSPPGISAIIITTLTALCLQVVEEIQDFTSNHRQCLLRQRERQAFYQPHTFPAFLGQEEHVELCKSTVPCQLYSRNKGGSNDGIHILIHSAYFLHEFLLDNLSIGPYFKETDISVIRKLFGGLWKFRLVLFQRRFKCP